MEFRVANITDIDGVMELHAKYQIDTIAEEDKAEGFVTTSFTREELIKLITDERGLFIAVDNGVVVGYEMSASWGFWSKWAMFRFMIKDLHTIEYKGCTLTVDNSYQYGPVCLDRSVRGSGLLKELFDFAYTQMSKRFPVLVTFVNKINPRSYYAHNRKLGLDVVKEFSYNSNEYYELCYCSV